MSDEICDELNDLCGAFGQFLDISYNMKGIISKVHQHHCVKNLNKIKTL